MLNIGTVSHGTHRPQDLLRSFSKAYEQYCADDEGFRQSLIGTANLFADLLDQRKKISPKVYEQVDAIIDDLMMALDMVAVRHNCYFGSHPGDGSDFGFWMNEPHPEGWEYAETGTEDD